MTLTEDTKLMDAVLRRATGADIHAVRGFIGYYRSCIYLAGNGSEHFKASDVQDAERRLRAYLAGDQRALHLT